MRLGYDNRDVWESGRERETVPKQNFQRHCNDTFISSDVKIYMSIAYNNE